MPPPVRLPSSVRDSLREVLQGRFHGQDHGSLQVLVQAVRASSVFPATGAGAALTVQDFRQEINNIGAGQASAAQIRTPVLAAIDAYASIADLEAQLELLESQITALQARVSNTTNVALKVALQAELDVMTAQRADLQNRSTIRARVVHRSLSEADTLLNSVVSDDDSPPPSPVAPARPIAIRRGGQLQPAPVAPAPALAVLTPATRRVITAVDLTQLERRAARPLTTPQELAAVPQLQAIMQGYFDACSSNGVFSLPDGIDAQGLQDLIGNLLSLVRFGTAQLPLTRLSDINRLSGQVSVLDASLAVVERAITTMPTLRRLRAELDRIRNTSLGFVPLDDLGGEFEIFFSDLFPPQRDQRSRFDQTAFWRYYTRAISGVSETALSYRDGPLSDPNDPASPRIPELGHRHNIYSIAMNIWTLVRQLAELMQMVDDALQTGQLAQAMQRPLPRPPSPSDDGAGAAAAILIASSSEDEEPQMQRRGPVRQRSTIRRPAMPIVPPQVSSDEEMPPPLPPRGEINLTLMSDVELGAAESAHGKKSRGRKKEKKTSSRPSSPSVSTTSGSSRKSGISGIFGLLRKSKSMPDLNQDDESSDLGSIRGASSMTDLRDINRPKRTVFRRMFGKYKKAPYVPNPMLTTPQDSGAVGGVPAEEAETKPRKKRPGFVVPFIGRRRAKSAPPPPPAVDYSDQEEPSVPQRPIIRRYLPERPVPQPPRPLPQRGPIGMVRPGGMVGAGGAGDPNDPNGPGGAGAPGGAAGGAGAPGGNPSPRASLFAAAAAGRQRHGVPYKGYMGPALRSTLSEHDLVSLSQFEDLLVSQQVQSSAAAYQNTMELYEEAVVGALESHKLKNTAELTSEAEFGIDASLKTSQKASASRAGVAGIDERRKTASELLVNYRFFDIKAKSQTVVARDPSLLSALDLANPRSRDMLEQDPYFNLRMNRMVVAGNQVGLALSSPKESQLANFYQYLFENTTPGIHILMQENDYIGESGRQNNLPRYHRPEQEYDRRQARRGMVRVTPTDGVRNELKNTVYIPQGGIQTGLGMMQVSHRPGRKFNDALIEVEQVDSSGNKVRVQKHKGSFTEEVLLDLTVNGRTHTVSVLQSPEWQDMHGTPIEVLDELLEVRRQAFHGMQLSDTIVHCRAGVGRTGTMLAAESMQNLDVSLMQAVTELRDSRNRIVVQKGVQAGSLFRWAVKHNHQILHDHQGN